MLKRGTLSDLRILVKKIRACDIVIFLPHFGIGGAERVHIEILRSVRGVSKFVLFDNFVPEPNLLPQFLSHIRDDEYQIIRKFQNNRLTRFLFIFLLWIVLGTKKKGFIFGCNSMTFYRVKMFWFLRRHKILDLVHTFASNIEYFRKIHMKINFFNSLFKIDKRIYIDETSRREFEAYFSKLPYIESCVQYNCVNYFQKKEKHTGAIKVGFIGRLDKAKRIHLLMKVIERVLSENNQFRPITFSIVGFASTDLPKGEFDAVQSSSSVEFQGVYSDSSQIQQWYNEIDVLILTSSYEGFPMVIMESMAQGVLTLATDVGGISEHITHGYNGFLVDNDSENEIIDSFARQLTILNHNEALVNEVSLNAFNYAFENFNQQNFRKFYRSLFSIE